MKGVSRRQFLCMAGGVTAVGMLAACGVPATTPSEARQQTTGSPSEQSKSSGPMTPQSKKVSLKWDTFRAPGTGWNEERIKTFQEQYPNVEIDFRPLTGASQQDNYGKMYAQFAAGDLGDVIAFDPSHFHFWRAIDKGIVAPLDELVAADKTDLKQWFPQFINLQRYKGKLYGLPSWGWAGQDTIVINAVHLKEAGITPPDPVAYDTSMDTYAEWARRLYKRGDRFGLGLGYGEANLVTLTRAFNGDLIDAEGKKCLLMDDNGAQEALRWAYKLAVEEKVLPRPVDMQNMASALLDGKLSMFWGGSLNVRNFKRDIKDSSVAEATQGLLPMRTDGRPPSQIRGGTWNILAGCKYPQEAFQFIKHITSFDGTMGFNLVAGQGAFVRPDVLQELVKRDPVHEWFIPNLEKGIPAHAPANSRGREYTDACQQWATRMMDPKENVPFEQGLQDLHNNIQRVLDMDPA